MNNDLPDAKWKDRLLYLLGRRVGILVEGGSMEPALTDGDTVLADPRASIEPGDIVVAQHPYKQSTRLIKRVAEITASGGYVLEGDNPDESTDSRTFGELPPGSILGKVICRLK